MTAKLNPTEVRSLLFFKKQKEICQKKKRFLDENTALSYLDSRLKSRKRVTDKLEPYECRWCKFWHLTTKRVE